jgi:hypothetical protein
MTMRYLSTRRYAFAALAIFFALIMGFAPSARAQSQAGSGQVVGTTYDSSGSTVPDAKVALASKALGINRETTTNQEGQYLFVLVPIGHYSVTFTKTGFKTYKVDVEVTVGSAVTVNATLALGEVSQVVEVTATPLIESTEIRPDATIGVRKIEELPINGRRFQDFVTLTPTVQIEPQRSGISFAGQRGINGYVAIDGADYTEPFFGGIRGGERSNNAFTIPQEAISQFQVVSYGFSVEFGRSTGGLVNATTKSGSNDWHGSAFMYARNGELAKADAFGRSAITNLYQGGGSFGGPVKHDKLFFFAAYEVQRNEQPHVVIFHRLDGFPGNSTLVTPARQEAFDFYQGQDGSQAGLPFTTTNDGYSGLGRLDWQINANHRVTFRYHYSKGTGENAVSTGDPLSVETTRALSNNGTEGDQTNTGTSQWTAIFSPTTILETRFQYGLENRPRSSNSAAANIQGNIATTGARDFLPNTLDDYRIQASSNLSWTHGTHTVKFGGEYDHINANQLFFFNQFGSYILSIPSTGTLPPPNQSIDACAGLPLPPGQTSASTVCSTVNSLNLLSTGGSMATGDPVHRLDTNGAPSNTSVVYKVNIGNGLLNARLKQVAFFIQDQWRISPRLTVTAGFRWEGYINPQPDTGNSTLYNQVKNFAFPLGLTGDPAVIPNNYRQYMPRVGLAWDINGRGTTVVRANAGFFYAPTPLLILAAPLNNFRATPGDLSVQLPLALPAPPAGQTATCQNTVGLAPLFPGDTCNTTYDQMRRIGIDLDTFTLDKLPTLTPTQITQIATNLNLPSPNPFKGAAPIFMANNYESPRSWQWNVGIEHEITRGWSAGLDFAYINTVHLERNRNLNLPKPIICAGVLPAACKSADLSLRPCSGVSTSGNCTQQRPVPSLGDVTIRATDARSRYQGMTLRTNYRRGRVQFQSYYTLSYSYSDDDNERLAGGFDHDNEFDLAAEYNFARLDTRHLWVTNGLIDLPGGVTLASLGKFRSGHPMEPLVGSDVNGDNTNFPDRAFQSAGVPFLRNSFRDLRQFNVDLRAAWHVNKLMEHLGAHFREGMRLDITADFFNIFNFADIQFISSTPSPFTSTDVFGLGVDKSGTPLLPNASFRLLRAASFCSKNSGCYNTDASPGPPLTMQLGVRFQF